MSPSPKPTLVSLARDLGVSRQTVSNVINAPDLVKPETRERVRAAIETSGYRPSAMGRALRTQRSMTLALRVRRLDEINGTVRDRFLHALTYAAQSAHYRIMLFAAADDEGEYAELEALRAMRAVDGCVLTDSGRDDTRPGRLTQLGCPFVSFGRPWGGLPGDHAWVDVDGARGTGAAVRHLLDLGHTRIGFIGWPEGSGSGDDRRAGWREAVAGVLDDPDALAVAVADGVRTGREAARLLRDRGATAAVCASDSLALGAFPVFLDPAQRFVPVVGFDDTPVARALGLSSIAQPVEDAGRLCVTTLVALLKNPDADPSSHHLILAPTLVPRDRDTGWT